MFKKNLHQSQEELRRVKEIPKLKDLAVKKMFCTVPGD